MDQAAYDNVEFPVRRPAGSGTWPGPGQNTSTAKIHIITSSKERSGPKLDPVIEGEWTDMAEDVDIPEVEDQRQQARVTPQSTYTSTKSLTHSNNTALVHGNNSQNSSKSTTKSQTTKTEMTTTTTPTHQINISKPPVIMDESRSQNEDFKLNDFNPPSQELLDSAYTRHKYFYLLSDLVLDQANQMKKNVWDVKTKPGEILSYEQMIQGMLVDGEKILLGGGWLYFLGVDFWDATESSVIKSPVRKGRICLTSLRLLILSAETASDANFSAFGDPNKQYGGYKLDVSKYNSTYYQNIALSCVESAELIAAVGTGQRSKLNMTSPICCGIFSCIGIGRCGPTWKASPPMPVSINKKTIKLGIRLPPWQTPCTLIIHLHPDLPLTTARDFISQLQSNAPHMNQEHQDVSK